MPATRGNPTRSLLWCQLGYPQNWNASNRRGYQEEVPVNAHALYLDSKGMMMGKTASTRHL